MLRTFGVSRMAWQTDAVPREQLGCGPRSFPDPLNHGQGNGVGKLFFVAEQKRHVRYAYGRAHIDVQWA